jgi:hypothetical protein
MNLLMKPNSKLPVFDTTPSVLQNTITAYQKKAQSHLFPTHSLHLTAGAGYVQAVCNPHRAVGLGPERRRQCGLLRQQLHERASRQVPSPRCFTATRSSHLPPPPPLSSPLPFMYPATCNNAKYPSCKNPPGQPPPPGQLGRTQIVIVSDPLASIYKCVPQVT